MCALGINWPEGGSSTSVTPVKERRKETAEALLSSASQLPIFFSPADIYLHCRDRGLTLIEKHGSSLPASSFIFLAPRIEFHLSEVHTGCGNNAANLFRVNRMI